jgi:hypothetical protein
MIDPIGGPVTQASLKERRERQVRRLTGVAVTSAIALAGSFMSLAAWAPPAHGTAGPTPVEETPTTDQALASAIGDYEAAVAKRSKSVAAAVAPRPRPTVIAAAPVHKAVAVSGGS